MAGLYILETLYVWPRLTPGKPAAFIDEVGIGVVVRAFAWMDAPKPDPSKDQSFKRLTRPNFDRLRHMEPSGKVSQLSFCQIFETKTLTRLDQNQSERCPMGFLGSRTFALPCLDWNFALVPAMQLAIKSQKNHLMSYIYQVYKWYILPIGWLYATYHLLQEPEKSID